MFATLAATAQRLPDMATSPIRGVKPQPGSPSASGLPTDVAIDTCAEAVKNQELFEIDPGPDLTDTPEGT